MTPECISALELKHLLTKNESIPYVVDLREPYECELGRISTVNIPLAELLHRREELPKDRLIVLYCASGRRSAAAVDRLKCMYGLEQITHLEGGIKAWVTEVDPSLTLD